MGTRGYEAIGEGQGPGKDPGPFVLAAVSSGGWPYVALVFAAYAVEDLDPRRTITEHQYRFYAVPSFVDFVGAPFRTVPVSGPSRVAPFACSRIVRRPGFLVETENVHVTPTLAANRFLLGAAAGARPERNACYNDDTSPKGAGQATRKAREDRGRRAAERPAHGRGGRPTAEG